MTQGGHLRDYSKFGIDKELPEETKKIVRKAIDVVIENGFSPACFTVAELIASCVQCAYYCGAMDARRDASKTFVKQLAKIGHSLKGGN